MKLNLSWFSIRVGLGTLIKLINMRQPDLQSLIASCSEANIAIVLGGLKAIIYMEDHLC